MNDAKPALLFDVFGTVVDWRSSIRRELESHFQPRGVHRDWDAFALDWRARYQPSMEAVRSGRRTYVDLDHLHRENLIDVLKVQGITGLDEAEIAHVAGMWHRLAPWPDSVPGMARLRQGHILASLSNGNVALMIDLARHGGLHWDAILGADFARNYKPDASVYLSAVQAVGRRPEDCMMVAAHNDDLRAAQALGLKTAFVLRASEYGPTQSRDLAPEGPWDYVAQDMEDLAAQLGL